MNNIELTIVKETYRMTSKVSQVLPYVLRAIRPHIDPVVPAEKRIVQTMRNGTPEDPATLFIVKMRSWDGYQDAIAIGVAESYSPVTPSDVFGYKVAVDAAILIGENAYPQFQSVAPEAVARLNLKDGRYKDLINFKSYTYGNF